MLNKLNGKEGSSSSSSASISSTTALDYYCKKKESAGNKMRYAHFWELGGSDLLELADCVITPAKVESIFVTIFLDLSRVSL